jgi:hypothetical protein
MTAFVRSLLVLPLTAGMAAAQLDLTLDKVVDISPLGFVGVGGAAFDDASGHLWICESQALNVVVELDPSTGDVSSSFPARVIPGFTGGPDGLAIHPVTGHLFLFGLGQEAGEVSQSGVLVDTLQPQHVVAAAFDPEGDLYVVERTLGSGFPGGGVIHRVNQATGAFETTVTVNDYSGLGQILAMDFDPVSGNLFLCTGVYDDALLEIELATGDALSVTHYGAMLSSIDYPVGWSAGIAFNADGTQLFLSVGDDFVSGAPLGGEFLVVIDRHLPGPPDPPVPPGCDELTEFADLGNGLPGSLGFTPLLGGQVISGTCTVQLQLVSLVQVPGTLVVGLGQIDLPFKGGVMVPEPALLLPNAFGPTGTLSVDLPEGVLAGTTIHLQAWLQDPAGPAGFSATNGLAITPGV